MIVWKLRRLIIAVLIMPFFLACSSPTSRTGLHAIADGVRVDRALGIVEVDAIVAIEAGVLEAAACMKKTREHESLVVVSALPSVVHTALLLAGFEPGEPGSWRELYLARGAFDRLDLTPPRGALLAIDVRLADGSSRPLSRWIRATDGVRAFPSQPWVFAGSRFARNPKSWNEPGEHFVADYTGQLVGVVTFGDEVIAFDEVLPDQVEFAQPEWEVDTTVIPPSGTPVVLVIRARQNACPQ